jgi:hypothetical protein
MARSSSTFACRAAAARIALVGALTHNHRARANKLKIWEMRLSPLATSMLLITFLGWRRVCDAMAIYLAA